ncbi:MAG TPA: IS5 family transposase [Gemmatimonadales bacterium]|nr:IS5 family transposase [Gemmatimonadales bacterium]
MRGIEPQQVSLFSYVSLEARIPAAHPLRAIRPMVDAALAALSPTFDAIYKAGGRPSIPPEHLLRALLLQVLYTIRSEIQLMEQLEYNLLYRWFVGLGVDDPTWDVTVFTKNRERLLTGAVADGFFAAVLAQAKAADLLSSEHFTVDGTLVRAWAGQKSFQRDPAKTDGPPPDGPPPDGARGGGRNPGVSFRGERRSNATHTSTTDPEACLARHGKGKESQLAYEATLLMENRSGLAVGAVVGAATGPRAERDNATVLVASAPYRRPRVTVGADKGFDTRECVGEWRALAATPHVAQNVTPRHPSAVDARTTRHPGYAVSQRVRKRIEEIFGWLKTIGLCRQTHFRGAARVGWMVTFATAVYNLVRMRRLVAA